MNLAQKLRFVPIVNTADYNNGADGDSINMGKASRATIIIMFGAITGDSILKLFSGAANAAKTSALTFKYALGSAVVGTASADVLAAQTTSAALTLVAATYANKMLVLEIDAAQMDIANSKKWLTLEIGAEASAGIAHAVAIIEPRYSDSTTLL